MVQVKSKAPTGDGGDVFLGLASDALHAMDGAVRALANGAVEAITLDHYNADQLAGIGDSAVFGGTVEADTAIEVAKTAKTKTELGAAYQTAEIAGGFAGAVSLGKVIAGAGTLLVAGGRAVGLGASIESVSTIGGTGRLARYGKAAVFEGASWEAQSLLSASPAIAAEPSEPVPTDPHTSGRDEKEDHAEGGVKPTVAGANSFMASPIFQALLNNPELREFAVDVLGSLESLCKEMPMLANLLESISPGLVEKLSGMKELLENIQSEAPKSNIDKTSQSSAKVASAPSTVPTTALPSAPHRGEPPRSNVDMLAQTTVPASLNIHGLDLDALNFDPSRLSQGEIELINKQPPATIVAALGYLGDTVNSKPNAAPTPEVAEMLKDTNLAAAFKKGLMGDVTIAKGTRFEMHSKMPVGSIAPV